MQGEDPLVLSSELQPVVAEFGVLLCLEQTAYSSVLDEQEVHSVPLCVGERYRTPFVRGAD